MYVDTCILYKQLEKLDIIVITIKYTNMYVPKSQWLSYSVRIVRQLVRHRF